MKSIRNIRILSSLGLVAILSLQVIWLLNTYILVRNDIMKVSSEVLKESFNKEIELRVDRSPKGTQIIGGSTNDSIPHLAYFNDGLEKIGMELSLNDMDSITSSLLCKKYDITCTYMICLIDMKTGKELQKSKPLELSSYKVIKTSPFPIKADLSQGVQLVLLDPHWTIFKRMGLLIVATALMMIMVITCIIYQIKIIIRQDKIAKMRQDFSYAMIHDMKTPLSSITSCAGFLRSGKMDDNPVLKEKFFKIIDDEAGHLISLTNKVLTISKLESHKLEMNKTKFLLEPMITDLIEKFSTKSAKQVHFITDLQAEEVYADAEYMMEAISNLIDNAIKYSQESVEIKISSLTNATYTLIKVHDNGIGISEKDQKMIFEKFERASAFKRSRLGKVAGFGLGLNYVYQVMEAHEGNVTVNSIEKEFSEFTLYVPIKNELATV